MVTAVEFVHLSGGVTVPLVVFQRLIEIEARGGSFEALDDGRLLVRPRGVATADDKKFLQAHRADAVRAIKYIADDRHLHDDAALRAAS
jgi:hypothetical protein